MTSREPVGALETFKERIYRAAQAGDLPFTAFEARQYLEIATSIDEAVEAMRRLRVDEAVIQAALPQDMRRQYSPEEVVEIQEQREEEAETRAEDVAQALGFALVYDADGNPEVDGNGYYKVDQVDPRTGYNWAINPTNGDTQLFLPDFTEVDEEVTAIGGFDQEYYDLLRENQGIFNEELLDRIRAIDKPGDKMLEVMRRGEGMYEGRELGKAQYNYGDQFRHFATKSPGHITQVQQALVEAGLLDKRDYVGGIWTREAAAAMEKAMVEANATGGAQTWVQVLERRARGERLEDEDTGRGPLAGRVLTLPAFREPDYATLSQDVKTLFRNQLGRDPVDWEVALLADQLNTDYRSAYDVEKQAAIQEFEAGNHAILTAEDSDDPQIAYGGTVQSVDPVARLKERFESRWANSRDLAMDRVDNAQDVSNVFSILTQTTNALSRGVR